MFKKKEKRELRVTEKNVRDMRRAGILASFLLPGTGLDILFFTSAMGWAEIDVYMFPEEHRDFMESWMPNINKILTMQEYLRESKKNKNNPDETQE